MMRDKGRNSVRHEDQKLYQGTDPQPDEDPEKDGSVNVDAPRRSGHERAVVVKRTYQ